MRRETRKFRRMFLDNVTERKMAEIREWIPNSKRFMRDKKVTNLKVIERRGGRW